MSVQRDKAHYDGVRARSTALLTQYRLQPTDRSTRPDVYILGSHETNRVTVASQQVRAINLVNAVWGLGEADAFDARASGSENAPQESKSLKGKDVWVVGAGVGGLTTAACAAQHGAKVTVFDRESRILSRFRDSRRLLHPRLYEWGSPQDFSVANNSYWAKGEAELPLLSWNVDSASNVVESIERQWEGWRTLFEIDVKLRSTLSVGCDGGFFLHDPDTERRDVPKEAILVLALGFGEEPTRKFRYRGACYETVGYFSKTEPVDQIENISNCRATVCGNGDGAITDLLRLLVCDFSQRELERWICSADPVGKFERAVLEIEAAQAERRQSVLSSAQRRRDGSPVISTTMRNEMRSSERTAEAYLDLRCDALDDLVRAQMRRGNDVVLSVRPIYGRPPVSALASSAFPLNKFLLASILRVCAQNQCPPLRVVHETRAVPDLGEDRYLVYRVGPKHDKATSVLGSVHLRNTFERLGERAASDITRVPEWTRAGEVDDPGRLRRPDFVVPVGGDPVDLARVFEKIGRFDLVADVFDSTFQGALSACDPTNDKKLLRRYYLGMIRAAALFNSRILVTDAQVWDGSFMASLPEIYECLSSREQETLRSKLVVRIRQTAGGNKARDTYAKPAYVMSSFSPELNESFRRFLSSIGDVQNISIDTALRRLLESVDNKRHEQEVDQIICRWGALDKFVGNVVKSEIWPNAAPWDVDLCYEDPGRAYWESRNKKHLQDLFSVRPDEMRGARSPMVLKMGSIREGLTDPHEIAAFEEVRDWYERAYNRMVARSQGASAYMSLYAKAQPGSGAQAQEEGILLEKPLRIEALGALDSERYAELSVRLSAGVDKWYRSGQVEYKRDILEEVQSALNTNANEGLGSLAGHAHEHLADKAIAAGTVEGLFIETVSRRAAGPTSRLAAREQSVSTLREREAVTSYGAQG
ncbi:MAG: NAD(P)-binding protein [Rhodospirillales bacterium]|nr:MAG: NAD(P)-binding protein [Rhodospirillales bacterium]